MRSECYSNRRSSIILIPLLLIASGCNALVEILDCDGYVEHGYDIPDVVLVANAEQYVRDLEAHPHVFYQTEGERLFFDAESSNYSTADASTDEYGFLTVVAGRPGEARIVVEAHDTCGSRAATSFRVEVIPYRATGQTRK